MLQTITAGLLLGLISSMHCVGMCGPLAFALPLHHVAPPRRLLLLALYHSGRIAVYTLAGFAFGLAGHWLYLAGMQQVISIGLGIVMMLTAFHFIFSNTRWQLPVAKKFNLLLQQKMIKLLKAPSVLHYFLFGIMNGMLPCGMVYVAIAGAISTHNILHATLFMGSFGIATLPAMFALGYFRAMLSLNVRNSFRKLSPYVIGVLGIVLVLRGMNLGIPFISPVMQTAHSGAINCR